MAEAKKPGATNKDSGNDTGDALAASEQTIDPRLDNRVGNQRPPLETFPAKPQQIDGPDLANTPTAKEAGKAAESMREDENSGITRKGMQSPGPHGLGETEAVPFEDANNVTPASEKAQLAADQAKTTKEDGK